MLTSFSGATCPISRGCSAPVVDLPPVVAHLVEMLALGGMSLLGLGAGLRVLGLLGVAGLLSAGERLLFGLALGYGVLAFLMLAVGLLGILYLPVGLVLLAGLG